MESKNTKSQLLLLEDVRNLGRKGDLVQAKPGFVRNFLLPTKKAVIADKRTIRLQERLQEERAKQAAQDKKDAEALAKRLKDKMLTTTVKVDSQGHLYGSVAAVDIVKILHEEEGVELERKNVLLPKPIKVIGEYEITLRLKEEVPASFKLKVRGDQVIEKPKPHVEVVEEGEEPKEEAAAENAGEDLPLPSERRAEVREEIEERSKD